MYEANSSSFASWFLTREQQSSPGSSSWYCFAAVSTAFFLSKGTFWFKTSMSTFKILIRNLKSDLNKKIVKISYQKNLILDIKAKKIPTHGLESM